jgi:hypothetical protein
MEYCRICEVDIDSFDETVCDACKGVLFDSYAYPTRAPKASPASSETSPQAPKLKAESVTSLPELDPNARPQIVVPDVRAGRLKRFAALVSPSEKVTAPDPAPIIKSPTDPHIPSRVELREMCFAAAERRLKESLMVKTDSK